jgi:hypothetical protein
LRRGQVAGKLQVLPTGCGKDVAGQAAHAGAVLQQQLG